METNRIGRILLIDDDVFIVRLLSIVLTKSGYGTISACDGKDDMRVLSGQPVDMIIPDLMMPEMDGLLYKPIKVPV